MFFSDKNFLFFILYTHTYMYGRHSDKIKKLIHLMFSIY